ncbi:MAG: family 16 glycosylhydrolase [Terracidiphilus sp.]
MKNLLNAKLCCAFCLGALPIVPALGQTIAAPVISTTAALHGAVVVSLSTTTPGATIWYATQDSYSLQRYDAPFLVDSKTTLMARASVGTTWSSNTIKKLAIPKISPGTLVWEDEFSNSTGSIAEPNPNFWTYGTGTSGTTSFLGAGIQDYCAWNSSVSPCNPSEPNVFVNPHGGLAIVAQNPSSGVYTAGQLTTQGLFSFQYGRIEVRAKVPEARGFWPAVWLLGNSISTVGWPACGEQDVLERIDAAGWPERPGRSLTY